MPARRAQASDWCECAGSAGVGRRRLREIETELKGQEVPELEFDVLGKRVDEDAQS